MRKELIDIRGEVLKEALTKRGLSCKQASLELGYGESFFNNCISRNKINTAAAKMLYLMYRIPEEEYIVPELKVEPEKEEPEKPAEQAAGIDYQLLFKVIYKAVLEALKKARVEE